VARKRRLQAVYYVLRLPPWTAGAASALIEALAFKEILTARPELVDNLLAVRESLFTLRPNDRRFPGVSGESVFCLTAWDAAGLEGTLATIQGSLAGEVRIAGPAQGFTPGRFTRLHLDLVLPREFFSGARAKLETYLRGAYVAYSLRREGTGYVFDLPPKALKKKVLLGGSLELREDGLVAALDVGPRFDLGALLDGFGGPGLHRHAQAHVSAISW
jgi:hypothetical protein